MQKTTVVPFDAEQWVEEETGVRALVREDAGERWAVVEYAPGSGRSGWCDVAHHIYVVSGEIQYDLKSGGSVTARAGQGLYLGTDDEHRGANRGSEPARLVVIDLGGHAH